MAAPAARPEKTLPEEVLDDISCRFFNTIPTEELEEESHVGAQIEMAHWFYIDHMRKRDPSLPGLNINAFSRIVSRHCPILKHTEFGTNFLAVWKEYKGKIPVCGAVLLNSTLDKIVLVQSFNSKSWTFPRGKKNRNETSECCAIREVFEETGFDIDKHLNGLTFEDFLIEKKPQHITLFYIRNVPEDFDFQPKTEGEISKIEWFDIDSLIANTSPNFRFVKSTVLKIKKWVMEEKKKVSKTPLISPHSSPSNSLNVHNPTSSLASSSSIPIVSDHISPSTNSISQPVPLPLPLLPSPPPSSSSPSSILHPQPIAPIPSPFQTGNVPPDQLRSSIGSFPPSSQSIPINPYSMPLQPLFPSLPSNTPTNIPRFGLPSNNMAQQLPSSNGNAPHYPSPFPSQPIFQQPTFGSAPFSTLFPQLQPQQPSFPLPFASQTSIPQQQPQPHPGFGPGVHSQGNSNSNTNTDVPTPSFSSFNPSQFSSHAPGLLPRPGIPSYYP